MITAEQARNMRVEHLKLVHEAKRELSKLSRDISAVAYEGGNYIIREISSNNVILAHITETLRQLGYGWTVDLNVNDKTVLTIWW